MALLDAVRPRRGLVVPATAVAAPLAYFVYRDAAPDGPVTVAHLAALGGAVVAGYLGGVLVHATVGSERQSGGHGVARRLLAPDGTTLAVFAASVLSAAAYLTASVTVGVPPVVTTLAMPVGLVLGLPLVALYGGLVVVGNAVGSEPALGWQAVVVGLGVALSAMWTAALGAGLSALLSRD